MHSNSKNGLSWVKAVVAAQLWLLGNAAFATRTPPLSSLEESDAAQSDPAIYFAYDEKDLLGRGRYGEVYHFQQPGDSAQLALKVFNVEEFVREAPQIFAHLLERFSIKNEHIAEIIWACPPADKVSIKILTEYFPRSLNAAMEKHRIDKTWFKVEEMLSIISGIASGVNALHEKGLFHGRLKPSEIFIKSGGNPVITDYLGYSFERLYLTFASDVKAYPEAPEIWQFADEEFDLNDAGCVVMHQKIDVFALALVLHEVITGKPAFEPGHEAADYLRLTQSRSRPSSGLLRSVINTLGISQTLKDKLYAFVNDGWDADPTRRHLVGELCNILGEIRRLLGHI
jgi:serine/threonine protein kinase